MSNDDTIIFPSEPRVGDAHVHDGDIYVHVGGNRWKNISVPRFMISENTLFREDEMEVLMNKYIGKDITTALLIDLLDDFNGVILTKSGKHVVIHKAF